MRKPFFLVTVALGVAGAQSAQAANYNDTVGEGTFGWPHLDIASVAINNTGTDITFNITLAGDPVAVNWGKYLVGIDAVPGGDAAGNGWGRPISMPSGMDYFIGSWTDSGNGAEVRRWDGSAWVLDHATWNLPSDILVPVVTTSSVTLQTTLASLGLSIGDTFTFDVFSSGGGGGDSAIDALSDPNQAIPDWPGPYASTSTLQYTVVPEPTILTLGALGLAAFWITRRRGQ
jgi:hypothetical protein